MTKILARVMRFYLFIWLGPGFYGNMDELAHSIRLRHLSCSFKTSIQWFYIPSQISRGFFCNGMLTPSILYDYVLDPPEGHLYLMS